MRKGREAEKITGTGYDEKHKNYEINTFKWYFSGGTYLYQVTALEH